MHRELDWDHYRYCHEFPEVLHVRDETHIAAAAQCTTKALECHPPRVFFCVGQAEILRVHIAILISVDAAQHIWLRDIHPREILLVGTEHFRAA
jgi:hypothetical protein